LIYAFAKDDTRKQRFVELLASEGLDYDIAEHDRSVIRILGKPTETTLRRLEEMGLDRRSLTLGRRPESSLYTEISDKLRLCVIAGPCAVESEKQLADISAVLAEAGVTILRGGAYKPRTSPQSFQGLGVPGLKLLRKYADRYNLRVVTEVMDREHLHTVAEYADMIQVGSRNMFNYTLLTALGSINRPILLKRGMAATISEWLESARYVQEGGNQEIVLCERGIRTFEPELAHTLDLGGMLLAGKRSGLPVIADASHAVGRADLVEPLTAAAIAAGADGIMVEVHPQPELALSDGRQALRLDDLTRFVSRCHSLYKSCQARSENDPQ